MTPVRRRGVVALGVLLGLFGGLVACESTVQRQRLDTCRRAVPALAPNGGAIEIQRVGSGSDGDSIRVDYQADRRAHVAVCRFNAGALLVGITVDRKALSDASLYLLKRYYLDMPDDGAAASPAR